MTEKRYQMPNELVPSKKEFRLPTLADFEKRVGKVSREGERIYREMQDQKRVRRETLQLEVSI